MKLIGTVERYKTLLELALENNHLRLSKAIQEDVNVLSQDLKALVGQVEKNNKHLAALTLRTNNVEGGLQQNALQLTTINRKAAGTSGSLVFGIIKIVSTAS